MKWNELGNASPQPKTYVLGPTIRIKFCQDHARLNFWASDFLAEQCTGLFGENFKRIVTNASFVYETVGVTGSPYVEEEDRLTPTAIGRCIGELVLSYATFEPRFLDILFYKRAGDFHNTFGLDKLISEAAFGFISPLVNGGVLEVVAGVNAPNINVPFEDKTLAGRICMLFHLHVWCSAYNVPQVKTGWSKLDQVSKYFKAGKVSKRRTTSKEGKTQLFFFHMYIQIIF